MSDGDLHPAEVLRPTAVARALRHPIRRGVLAAVLERQSSVAVSTITSSLATTGVTEGIESADRLSLRTALVHRHLPVLEDADLVEWTRRTGLVAPGDHGLLSRPTVDASWLRRSDANWDALAAVFGQPRRRVAVSILARRKLPVAVDVLARAVAAELVGDLSPDAEPISALEIRLHHVDLPILDDAGFLTYDATESRVVAIDDPDLPLPVEGL